MVADKAIQIAGAFDAKVHLIHVTSKNNSTLSDDRDVEYITPDNVSGYEREMETLNLFKTKFSKAGLNCEVHLTQGKPDVQILKTADKIHADMIVLGYIEHTAFYKTFIGSVSNEIVKQSPIPVLLVPAKK